MINPICYTDFYKAGHRQQYQKGTNLIYSNFTPRASRIPGIDKVVVFGIQYFIKDYLLRRFNDGFFSQPKETAVANYKRRLDTALGPDSVPVDHIEALHDLQYLPLIIQALPEGTLCPLRVPVLTLWNTKPDFFWLTNFIETILSNTLWGPMTSATIARQYRKILNAYAERTSDIPELVQWQGHDFSMRGMMGLEAACMSGAAHLLSFTGTDTIPAIDWLENFYNADSEKELIGGSVPATEHSVMCCGGKESEIETYKRLLTEVYPKGIVSVVSDTWDYWKVLTEFLPQLKGIIMSRDGKLVIRPDSGDPVDIICGLEIEDFTRDISEKQLKDSCLDFIDYKERSSTPHGEEGHRTRTEIIKFYDKYFKATVEFDWNRHDKRFYFVEESILVSFEEVTLNPEQKGSIQILWEIFGGTVNSKGYKQLDSHIGLIYGDSITIDRCWDICCRLEKKGFASTNIILGIGSYTYQYNTRDTFGFAMKSTYAEIDGKPVEIFKDPKTDNGVKRSAKGLLRVNDDLTLSEGMSWENVGGKMETVFENGKLIKNQRLSEIRERLNS